MLKSDDPPGNPNPIWFDIYREFEMNYSSLPKKYQNKFREERMFRQSIRRLTKRGFIKPLLVTQQAFSLDTDPRGYGYLFYSLTLLGRLTAEKLLLNPTRKLPNVYFFSIKPSFVLFQYASNSARLTNF
jgi:hypothetical protein